MQVTEETQSQGKGGAMELPTFLICLEKERQACETKLITSHSFGMAPQNVHVELYMHSHMLSISFTGNSKYHN